MENNVKQIEKATDEGMQIIVDLSSRTRQYCSITPKTQQEKIALFNATNNPQKRLSEMVNLTINAKDLYVESVECVNEDSGEVMVCPRMVIIDDTGKGYVCVSKGIYNALKKLITIFGEPSWTTPIPLEVKQIQKGAKSILTLNVTSK